MNPLYLRLCLASAAVCCGAMGAHAQDCCKPTHHHGRPAPKCCAPAHPNADASSGLSVVRTDSALQAQLKTARQAEPATVPLPNFAIQTKNKAFSLAVGGNISAVAGVDLGNDLYDQSAAGLSFVTGAIPVPATSGNRSDIFISALNSYLDFTAVGFAGTPNQITGYAKLSTNGINNAVSLSRAYITWRGFTMGQALTLAQDGDACQPPTIDPEGPNGMLSTVGMQVSYRSPSYGGFRYALGVELPTYYNSNGIYRGTDFARERGKYVDTSVNDMVPDFPMWVEYQASASNRIRATVVLRDFQYQDLVKNTRRDLFAWGTMLSGNFSFYSPLTFNFAAVYGKGIGNYLQDIAGRPLSFTPKNDQLGRMQANPMMGLTFGASYNITDKWQVNAVGSYSRIWDVAPYAVQSDNANYKYADYAAVNCFYNITNYLQWGLEYLYGRHVTWNQGGANDHRIQTQMSFTF